MEKTSFTCISKLEYRNFCITGSDVDKVDMWAITFPHFCQDNARGFLKINGKLGEGIVAKIERGRGRNQKFYLCPPLS